MSYSRFSLAHSPKEMEKHQKTQWKTLTIIITQLPSYKMSYNSLQSSNKNKSFFKLRLLEEEVRRKSQRHVPHRSIGAAPSVQSGGPTSGPGDVNLSVQGPSMGPGGCVMDCTHRKWCMTFHQKVVVQAHHLTQAHRVERVVPLRLRPDRRHPGLIPACGSAACPPL